MSPRVNRKAKPSAAVLKAKREADARARHEAFVANLVVAGLDWWLTEYRFHDARKWRFDYAWPHRSLALEVDGGVWVGGKHGRGSGIVKDHEKQNAAAADGWRVLRVTPKQLTDPATAAMVVRAYQWGHRE